MGSVQRQEGGVGRGVSASGIGRPGLVGMAGFRSANWYQYKPTAWVISDLEQNNGQALFELQRRFKGSTLNGKNHTRLVEHGAEAAGGREAGDGGGFLAGGLPGAK